MWGQVKDFGIPYSFDRIIPTRVGTSNTCGNFVKIRQDHPHACGDKTLGRTSDNYRKGSSPRVWGQVCHLLFFLHICRIIPTRVGTRYMQLSLVTVTWDHPHACGDKLGLTISKGSLLGSSPRVWGQEKYIICN